MNKVAVVQFETRKNHGLDELVAENAAYCKFAGYDYLMVETRDGEICPYWGKVIACKKVADLEKYESILFVDTDAVVMDKSFRIEDVLPDWALLAAGGRGTAVNAGVFALRLNSDGIGLLDEWLWHFNPDDWTFDPHEKVGSLKWKCKKSKWGGIGYEQGALNDLVIPRHAGRLNLVGWEFFLHCDSLREKPDELYIPDMQRFAAALRTTRVAHFCGPYKDLIQFRHKARKGAFVMYDESRTDTEEAMKEGVRICLGEPPPS